MTPAEIYRGSTPILNFTDLPFEADTITAGYITIQQTHHNIIDEAVESWTKSGTTVSLRLTQDDTLGLTANVPTTVQLRCRVGEDAFVSQKFPLVIKDVNKNGRI